MAFFDKLNDLAKNVGEKANDAIETTKLNNKINTEKAAIAEEFKKIGEYYYSKHIAGEVVDTAIEEYVISVDQHNAAITDAETQIRALKEDAIAARTTVSTASVIVCPACGKQNKSGTKFCCECGGKLELQSQPKARICTACGAVIGEGIKFCNECGTKLV